MRVSRGKAVAVGLLAFACCPFFVDAAHGRSVDKAGAGGRTAPEATLSGLTADAAKDVHALENYEQAIRRLLQLEQFGQLDDIAATARRTRARFAGGTWKLYVLYRGLRKPSGGLKASEEDWNQHVAS